VVPVWTAYCTGEKENCVMQIRTATGVMFTPRVVSRARDRQRQDYHRQKKLEKAPLREPPSRKGWKCKQKRLSKKDWRAHKKQWKPALLLAMRLLRWVVRIDRKEDREKRRARKQQEETRRRKRAQQRAKREKEKREQRRLHKRLPAIRQTLLARFPAILVVADSAKDLKGVPRWIPVAWAPRARRAAKPGDSATRLQEQQEKFAAKVEKEELAEEIVQTSIENENWMRSLAVPEPRKEYQVQNQELAGMDESQATEVWALGQNKNGEATGKSEPVRECPGSATKQFHPREAMLRTKHEGAATLLGVPESPPKAPETKEINGLVLPASGKVVLL
jgi:hypothetical protein